MVGRDRSELGTPPVSGTAAQNATATAKPFPAFQDMLVRVDAALIYHFYKNWSAKVGYAFEKSIWLGNDLRNYTAHMIGATLAYRFK